ncbi:glycerol-3-phosphate 1-O-acyltransferase PlsY [Rickettsiella endosymbiont of Dermanyssus gallinae]|uniref:glycerol-3-phosphate 1-O-acyltransferase PlsY n=1 Tax=Rickettsiella endosymbiont of Dermanyssus gallinae TaxID=2856608 RepID=UPI001C528A69|nr:glycerol-3-phosphate 1-O-acyltransferase PlsY [Rickettsiella endosymbiont of Dermanyssus gallinae]
MLLPLIFCLLAYLMGALSSAIIVCKCAGLPDPRTQGSGNPGASNVLRMGGKGLASIVFLVDMFKGWLPVIIASYLGLPLSVLAWVAFFAFLGHLFPIFFNFRGGKGVATALGGLLALAWPLGLFALLVWLVVLFLFRIISLASISAALFTFCYALYLLPPAAYFPILLMCVLLVLRHHANLRRLLAGQEPKLNLMKKDNAKKL